MGFISLVFGLITLIALVTGLISNLEPLIWAVAVMALAGLFLGLSAVQKQKQGIVTWTGIICSGLALIGASVALGIGHALI